MRPTSFPTSAATIAVNSLLVADFEADRRREELRRAEQRRGLMESEARSESRSLLAQFEAAFRTCLQPEHSLTDYPCRLPDGRMGRVAVIQQDGDWTMVCRMA
ncbi:MAG TPA: hypothetical protein VIK13_18060 [Candidatus Limnocylindrales bacterium]